MKILVIKGDEERIRRILEAASDTGEGISVRVFDDKAAAASYLKGTDNGLNGRIRIVTFGDFIVFADGKPVQFRYSKAQELFAVLVDARGRQVSPERISDMLWQDNEPGKNHASYLSILKKDMMQTLKSIGAGDIILQGEKGLSLLRDAVDCDYYDYLEGSDECTAFDGRYMEQYSWAEPTVGELTSIDRKRRSKDRA